MLNAFLVPPLLDTAQRSASVAHVMLATEGKPVAQQPDQPKENHTHIKASGNKEPAHGERNTSWWQKRVWHEPTALSVLGQLIHEAAHPTLAHGECGTMHWPVDCERGYDVSEVERSAAVRHDWSERDRGHQEAKARCSAGSYAAVESDGRWCYDTQNAHAITVANHTFVVPTNYLSAASCVGSAAAAAHGRRRLYLGKQPFARLAVGLTSASLLHRNSSSKPSSFVEFGAGIGQLGRAITDMNRRVEYRGYDGGGNVEEVTSKYVKWINLTQPFDVKRGDWVVALNVGERVPNRFEKDFIRNLHANNCRGIIMSWGSFEQGGHGNAVDGHGQVNLHSEAYVTKVFEALGYDLSKHLTHELSNTEKHGRLAKGIHVYERRHPRARDC